MNNLISQQEKEEIISNAKDQLAKRRGYDLFPRETGGWTRFDRMYDQGSYMERKNIVDEVLAEGVLLAESKLSQLIEERDEEIKRQKDIWKLSLEQKDKEMEELKKALKKACDMSCELTKLETLPLYRFLRNHVSKLEETKKNKQ